jgi:hypothetical protein
VLEFNEKDKSTSSSNPVLMTNAYSQIVNHVLSCYRGEDFRSKNASTVSTRQFVWPLVQIWTDLINILVPRVRVLSLSQIAEEKHALVRAIPLSSMKASVTHVLCFIEFLGIDLALSGESMALFRCPRWWDGMR